MPGAAQKVDAERLRYLERLEAEHAAEEWWRFAQRLVAMAAGSGGVGALIAPEGAAVGAVVGVLLGIVITARSKHRPPGE
jgi:hypothetical protein